MRVSHCLNTDNLIPQPVEAPVAEEQIKCRRRKLSNGGDTAQQPSGAVSPQSSSIGEDILSCLSENEEIIPKTGSTKLANTTTQMHSRTCTAFYVRLAEESPRRNYNDMSDSSTYGSFNCLETDICRDSSDTESNSSFTSGDIKTTIRVVEYDVASATNSEGLFTSDSSSGADDILIEATIYHKSKYSSDFADTEEDSSDTTSNYDSELTSADYWVCVKCKNKQNNPMFRFCEKCYQIRKAHFPPRPNLRKGRSLRNRSLKGGRGCSPVKGFTTSCNVNDRALKRKRRKAIQQMDMDKYFNSITPTTSSNSIQNGSTNSQSILALGFSQDHLKSTAESCSEDDNKTANEYCKNTKNNCKETRLDKYILNSTVGKKMDEDQPAQRLRTAMKRKLSMDSLSKYKSSPKRICSEENIASSIAQCDTENETDFALSQSLCGSQSTQRDSGFSSAPSSQERESSSSHQNDYDEGCASNSDTAGASSDTVCDSDVSEMCEEKDCIPSTLDTQEYSLDKHVSDMLPQTNTESHAIPTLVQSLSECSDAYTNMQASISVTDSLNIHSGKTENKLRPLQSKTENLIENDSNTPNYGSCIACLTEPKNGVFVHSKFLHLCCCYKCAVKIWNKNKKCPICNCAVKNVMKLFVH